MSETASIASADRPIRFDDDPRPHFKAGGFWSFQMDKNAGWMPGQWLRVTDPRDGAKRDAWWAAHAFSEAVVERKEPA